jgi:diaminohydroxyphosphoribosylaminopyrimidine deaminase/5-amino-6-(5-phosphoribosylamino)uracil reductase
MINYVYYLHLAKGIALGSFDPSSDKKVGCVIEKNNEIIGSGNRQVKILKVKPYKDVCFHAEHIALMEAVLMARGATMYCTVEPCTFRKIGEINAIPPPISCCELIVQYGISKLVFITDDNYVGSGGMEYLQEKGLEVIKYTMI